MVKEHGKAVCQHEFEYYTKLDRIRNAGREQTLQEFDDALKQSDESLKRFSAETSKRYKKFIETVNSSGRMVRDPNASTSAAANGSMVVGFDNEHISAIPKVDPVTKGPLVHPVKNRFCQHIYGKNSITESLKQSDRLRYGRIFADFVKNELKENVSFTGALTSVVRTKNIFVRGISSISMEAILIEWNVGYFCLLNLVLVNILFIRVTIIFCYKQYTSVFSDGFGPSSFEGNAESFRSYRIKRLDTLWRKLKLYYPNNNYLNCRMPTEIVHARI